MLTGTNQLAGNHIMRLNICLAALAATAAFASPAFAQVVTANATAEAHGLVLQPLTLTKSKDLDFGTLLASNVLGAVTIDADTGNRTVTGGVTAVASNPGQRALFTGAGTKGQQVNLTLTPPPSNLLVSTTSSSDTIYISSLVFNGGNALVRTIGNGGSFEVGVGGTFDIAASQPNGYYKADFTVTADYQ